ncbi:MAG TPA: septum formation initiator family protein [Ignavibacteriaceae bacterium]|nr:septum formation initiator family protein [Ignavibacteriaceae bacterium]
MKFLKSKKAKIILLLILFLTGAGFILFNEYGVLKYMKLKKEVNELNQKIEQTEKENRNLETGIDSLEKKVPAKIEETAREKYNMKRQGEKSVKVFEK